MIDSKDLRIGNVLKFNNYLLTVNVINAEFNSVNSFKLDKIEPIKLTPEILEQIGFKEFIEPSWFVLKVKDVEVFYDYNKYSVSFNDSDDIECCYLHDLQNMIYYNCNKQELPIDINTLKI